MENCRNSVRQYTSDVLANVQIHQIYDLLIILNLTSDFKRHLQNPVVLDQTDKDVKEELDSSRPYEELKILREQAVILLEKEMAPISFSTKTKENACI